MPSHLLPTFFVIGASKSGTTSLHHYLRAHPEIEMTSTKEPHVLCGPPDWRQRLFLYDRLFDRDAPARGEVSPGYAALPRDPDVPRRIHEIVPGARLVYLVRDPVERAIAHYSQEVTVRVETRGVDEALLPNDPNCVYVGASKYAAQVEAYLRVFDQQQLLVVDSTDLRHRRRQTLGRIFAHVGADPAYWHPQAFEREDNSRFAENVRRPKAEIAIARNRAYQRLRPLMPEWPRRAIRMGLRRFAADPVIPEVTEVMRSELAETLAPEAERLRALTGERFESWAV